MRALVSLDHPDAPARTLRAVRRPKFSGRGAGWDFSVISIDGRKVEAWRCMGRGSLAYLELDGRWYATPIVRQLSGRFTLTFSAR